MIRHRGETVGKKCWGENKKGFQNKTIYLTLTAIVTLLSV